jgi:pimeloyl-ACP methyl ester carboxylesterase
LIRGGPARHHRPVSWLPFHQIVPCGNPRPRRTVVFLHGILGSSRNWRPFARRFAEKCPDWLAVVVDVRHHDRSRAAPGPATIENAARDLLKLEAELGRRFDAVCGHSLGGKLALQLAAIAPDDSRRVWVLDASPSRFSGVRAPAVVDLLDALAALPMPARTRDEVVSSLAGQGWPAEIIGWIGTGLGRGRDGLLRWRFDIGATRHLLEDYGKLDLWPFLEQKGAVVDFVLGGRSDAVSSADLARLGSLERRGKVRIHVLERAGHWLHVDDPAGLLRLMTNSFACCRGPLDDLPPAGPGPDIHR